MAREHWERNHGEHKDLHNSNLDISFSPVILGHHRSQNPVPDTDDDIWATAAPDPSYLDAKSTTRSSNDSVQWAEPANLPSDIGI